MSSCGAADACVNALMQVDEHRQALCRLSASIAQLLTRSAFGSRLIGGRESPLMSALFAVAPPDPCLTACDKVECHCRFRLGADAT